MQPDQDRAFWIGLIGVLIVLGITMALVALAHAADNDPPCLTKEQARAKWPKAWLYWHGINRCWDNVSGRSQRYRQRYVSRRAVYGRENSLKLPKPHLDANASVVRHMPLTAAEIDNLQYREEAEKRLQTCCWPPPGAFIPWSERIEGSL